MAVYNISTFADLQDVRNHLSDDCVVLNDINGAGAEFGGPIGTQASPFTGTFDGGGYTLSNFTVTAGAADSYAALFGYIGTAANSPYPTVGDFTVSNVTIFHNDTGLASLEASALVYTNYGYLYDIVIDAACTFSVYVDDNNPATIRAASLVVFDYGWAAAGTVITVERCYSSATVSVDGQGYVNKYGYFFIGGLGVEIVGAKDSYFDGTIDAKSTYRLNAGGFAVICDYCESCYSSATITISLFTTYYASNRICYVGGFCSYMNGYGPFDTCWVTDAASLSITSPSDWHKIYAAGFLYIAAEDINNCYSRMGVTGVAGAITECYAAGFSVNLPDMGHTFDNCYSTGAVDTNADGFGGFAVDVDGQLGTITNSVFDQQTAGTAVSPAGGTAKTTSEMTTQGTFDTLGWDFDTIWSIVSTYNDGYPNLESQSASVETRYKAQLASLNIPYTDDDETKTLHITLENLSPTAKSAGEDGQVTIEIGYELAG